ncbi:MAG: hypothetical protein HYV97_03825 [Bdellovibrio sp.]|nr:hypothetical protein [Bdellovibrio sp.]
MNDFFSKATNELIDRIFFNREAEITEQKRAELDVAINELETHIIRESSYAKLVGEIVGKMFRKIFELTLEDLDLLLKESRRRDSNLFWNLTKINLKQKLSARYVQWNNSVIDNIAIKTGRNERYVAIGASSFCSFSDPLESLIDRKIDEYNLKTNFIVMKSVQDRRIYDIPDIAVMMAFPNRNTDHDEVLMAHEKFLAIKKASDLATDCRASIDKIDNPSLVHKDRISPSVEKWLEKSLLVICDLGGNRPNVYYEFGFARAIGTDLILTCPVGSKAEFHLAQWNIEYYVNLEELVEKLRPKIKHLLNTQDLSLLSSVV